LASIRTALLKRMGQFTLISSYVWQFLVESHLGDAVGSWIDLHPMLKSSERAKPRQKFGARVVTQQLKVNPRKAGNPSYDVSRDTCLSRHVNQTSHTHHHQSEQYLFFRSWKILYYKPFHCDLLPSVWNQ